MPTATAPARRRTRELESLAGLTAIDAIARVRRLELRPAVEPCDGGPNDHGLVVAQDPAAGTEVGRGQLVTLLVGECPESGEPPSPEQPPAEQRPAELRGFLAQPQRASELPPPALDTAVAPELADFRPDADPATVVPAARGLSPVPVPESDPDPEPEPESDPDPERELEQEPAPDLLRPPADGAALAAAEPLPTSKRRSQLRLRRPRRRRLLAVAGGLSATATLVIAGAGLPRLAGSPTQSTARRAQPTGPVGRHQSGHRRPRATGRPHHRRSPAYPAAAASTPVTHPASLADHPRPRAVTQAGASPVPVRATAMSPDPVSPIGPVPGPPPSQTGANP